VTGRAASPATHAERVRGLFDSKAASWPGKYAPGGRLTGRLSQLNTAIGDHVAAGGRLLDLGCGTGELARDLAVSGFRVAGCDIAPQMLRRAAAADPDARVGWLRLAPQWSSLPFGSASVDAVVAASVLEYVPDPCVVLRECARVLRPSGILLCTVPNPAHPVRWLEWLAAQAVRMPTIRTGFCVSPRLRQYMNYLQISRQRRPAGWWCAAAGNAGLVLLAHSARRSPLCLLIFQRPENTREYP
jgi:SAM-dependent methyltransferase